MIAFVLASLALCRQDSELDAPVGRVGIYEGVCELSSPVSALWLDESTWIAVESERDRLTKLTRSGEVLARFEGSFSDPRCVALGPEGKLFVSDAGHHQVAVLASDGHELARFGGYGGALGELRDPQGLCVVGDALFVCDTGNDRVQKFSFDGRALAAFGHRGAGEAEFVRPMGVAGDSSGNVYVTDGGNHRVQKFDAELHFAKAWGDFGPHPGFFAFPSGLACFEDQLYVVDTDNQRVQVFDLDGQRKYEWGLHALLPRQGEGRLHYPSSIALVRGRDGARGIVCEPNENRAQLFRATSLTEEIQQAQASERVIAAHFGTHLSVAGDLLAITEPNAPNLSLYDTDHEVVPWEPINITKLTAWGRTFGTFRHPDDVEIDWAQKLLYVSDGDARRISALRIHHDEKRELAFDFFLLDHVRSLDLDEWHRRGEDQLEFALQPSAIELAPDGDLWVVDSLQRMLVVLTPQMTLRAKYGPIGARPIDLAFSPDGRIAYVADELTGRIETLARVPGTPLPAAFGGLGDDDGHMRRIGGIAVAANGNVIVSDSANDRIDIFRRDGKYLSRLGQSGLGRREFHKPRGVDVDSQGRLWVLDWGNHRGQVFSPEAEFIRAFGARAFTAPTR